MNAVCHQAALGSVPRSIKDPQTTNEVNINGTLNVFNAAKENKIKKVVFASSSSVYGDNPSLPKKEDVIGNPLSPYAVTKQTGELYARAFSKSYDFNFILILWLIELIYYAVTFPFAFAITSSETFLGASA